VDPRLDRQQEVPRRWRQRVEARIEAGERRRAGEDAEVVDDVVYLAARSLRRPSDQPEQALVRVRLAEQVDRLAREELADEVAAVLRGDPVAEAREDDAVQATDPT
jgi:hypothetical protein